MFESSGHGGSLDEELFESWLEKGRSGKVGYHYLIVIWNSWDNDFGTRREQLGFKTSLCRNSCLLFKIRKVFE